MQGITVVKVQGRLETTKCIRGTAGNGVTIAKRGDGNNIRSVETKLRRVLYAFL